MILLVSGATATVPKFGDTGLVGRLYTPADGQSAKDDLPWAADNGAFSGFDERAFLRMLLKIKGMNGCRFVAAPDVVCNWQATSDLFQQWEPTIHSAGFPVAYVAQDGVVPQFIPWQSCEAVFIGGSTDWKLSDDAGRIIAEAKRRGKWRHVGRVNTLKRIKRCRAWGVDSIDGTRFSMFPDQAIALAVKWMTAELAQRILPL